MQVRRITTEGITEYHAVGNVAFEKGNGDKVNRTVLAAGKSHFEALCSWVRHARKVIALTR